jgi:hypothetical protein
VLQFAITRSLIRMRPQEVPEVDVIAIHLARCPHHIQVVIDDIGGRQKCFPPRDAQIPLMPLAAEGKRRDRRRHTGVV